MFHLAVRRLCPSAAAATQEKPAAVLFSARVVVRGTTSCKVAAPGAELLHTSKGTGSDPDAANWHTLALLEHTRPRPAPPTPFVCRSGS